MIQRSRIIFGMLVPAGRSQAKGRSWLRLTPIYFHESAANVQAVQMYDTSASAKSTIWWRKRLAPPSFLSPMASRFSWSLSGSISFHSNPLCSCFRFPRIALVLPRDCRLPWTIFRFWNCIGCTSAAKLQYYCWILALWDLIHIWSGKFFYKDGVKWTASFIFKMVWCGLLHL